MTDRDPNPPAPAARRAFRSAEAQIVFRHFTRVLGALLVAREEAQRKPPPAAPRRAA